VQSLYQIVCPRRTCGHTRPPPRLIWFSLLTCLGFVSELSNEHLVRVCVPMSGVCVWTDSAVGTLAKSSTSQPDKPEPLKRDQTHTHTHTHKSEQEDKPEPLKRDQTHTHKKANKKTNSSHALRGVGWLVVTSPERIYTISIFYITLKLYHSHKVTWLLDSTMALDLGQWSPFFNIFLTED
jgi:hypothetical protein